MQKFFRLLFFGWLLFIAFSGTAVAQSSKIRGVIQDESSGAALPFASVRLFHLPDSTFISGEVSDLDGKFEVTLKEGRYWLLFEFVGYNQEKRQVTVAGTMTDIGAVKLKAATKNLDEVVVQGEKSTYEVALDKRIFNVGKDLANAGGNAIEILNNVPSVAVDLEGNVSLRGSSSVRILVDGKPSGLVSIKGGAGLQQLQGSMIERIEVITNPSARYEAEGMGGIINIVLKKEQKEGLNGSFDIITGYPMNLGGAANLNFRHRKFNFFTNYMLTYRSTLGDTRQYQELYRNDSTFITDMTFDRELKAFHNNLRMGADYFFSESSILTAAYTWRRTKGKRYSHIHYNDYLTNTSNLLSRSYRTQDETETEPNSEYNLSYKKRFGRKGHELLVDVRHLDNWEKSDQYFGETVTPTGGEERYSLQRSINDETEKQWLFQVDYVQPFGKDGKFEAGARSSFRDMTNDYFVANVKPDGSLENIPRFTNYFLYDENIHALYGIYGNKHQKFSYQVGLRGEWSDVTTTLVDSNEVNNRKYGRLFPSVHVTYELPGQNALQVSFSRRIRRPGYNDLSPFMTFTDNRNYWSGNPDLNPEFTNSFELGHVKYLERGTFTSSLYYRHTVDKILQIRRMDESGFAYARPENLATENAYGLEFTGTSNVSSWLKLDGNLNFFRSVINGDNLNEQYNENENYDSKTFTWLGRLSARITWKGADFQLRNNYEAPQIMPQGKRKAIYALDFAVSRDVLKGNGTLTFNVLDVFNSRRFRTITQGSNFYTYNNSQGRVRQFNLTLNYRLKQAKTGKKGQFEE
ncbi:outer membrane beta-barrel family protein [Ravibacter arvi]|uniref:outer membrane beta-barrel family protein n=1 Tax=Ravibacter arvi TaxID=2051041 RepID=UPI0031E86B41